jgi:hypothetical protein
MARQFRLSSGLSSEVRTKEITATPPSFTIGICDKKDRRWQDIHRIFYYGSRAAGTGALKAKILYAAVMFGGARWGKGKSQCYASCHSPQGMTEENGLTVLSPDVSTERAQQIVDWVSKDNPSLEDIDAKTRQDHGLAVFD